MPHTRFYGSQVGGSDAIPLSYTGDPIGLLRHDFVMALKFIAFLPFIVWPFKPQNSRGLCELYPSWSNLWAMFLHLILVLMQLPFILSIPFWVFFPVWTVVIAVSFFMIVNQAVCYLLNGSQMQYASNPLYTDGHEHSHERWVFLNGVAVGKHWLQSNVDRLALTFGRPVLGVHNKTNGILFDVVQCLVQRNFCYATQDVRDCYRIVKQNLYDPQFTKLVFILHSQGGIEGGMIIDWLLQEVPQDLLAKLEVYTFGNAANHFNNPHLHVLSQHIAFQNSKTASFTEAVSQSRAHDADSSFGIDNKRERRSKLSRDSSVSGKTIRYIEHYAHTSDFVARWGVLHAVTNLSSSPLAPRFMGRLFERQGEGHQFNQHYLDNMFPLKSSPDKKGGIAGTGFEGVDEENHEFMNSIIEYTTPQKRDEEQDVREGLEMSYLGAHGEPLSGGETEVLMMDMSPIAASKTFEAVKREFKNGRGFTNGIKEEDTAFKVKDLSRLWLYRNGNSPKVDETDIGIARMATI